MSPAAPEIPTLVVFCRRPQWGVGKQRIAADAGPELALALGGRLLDCALEDALAWPGRAILSPSEAADHHWAAGLAPGMDVLPQPAGNLGERIAAVDRGLRAAGHQRIIYIGSDAPTLDPSYYDLARGALDGNDVVLGPAEDGGVTLMGSRLPWPELGDLPWSSPELGPALAQRCRARHLTVHTLPARYDVDTLDVLPRLLGDLAADSRPARRALSWWLYRQYPDGKARDPVADDKADIPVSVVIPVLGDTTALEELLGMLESARPQQIIVVDGAASRACEAICRTRGVSYINTQPGRGHQLRTGAALARGEVLWFLHADARPPADGLQAIRAAVRAGASGGYFRFRFAGPQGWHKRMLAAFINLRARFGIPYGDQGIFAMRHAYEKAGGFADLPLFEEVALVRGLRRAGRFVPLTTSIEVSPRRWERDGWLRRTLENRALALAFMAGVPAQDLARRYRAGHTVPAMQREDQKC